MTAPGGIAVRCIDVGRSFTSTKRTWWRWPTSRWRSGSESVARVRSIGIGQVDVDVHAGRAAPPDARGEIWLGDDELTTMPERHLLRVRGRRIGVVLQNPSRSLLPYATAEENILFARRARGAVPSSAHRAHGAAAPARPGRTGRASGRPNSPAANSSGCRSRWPWPAHRGCCWPTSRPVSWTGQPRQGRRSTRAGGPRVRHHDRAGHPRPGLRRRHQPPHHPGRRSGSGLRAEYTMSPRTARSRGEGPELRHLHPQAPFARVRTPWCGLTRSATPAVVAPSWTRSVWPSTPARRWRSWGPRQR